MLAHLKRSNRLFTDETRAPVLDPGAGKTRTGYLRALTRDDRGWGGEAPPAAVFTYLRETLTAIANRHPASRIDDLMPWAFQKPSS